MYDDSHLASLSKSQSLYSGEPRNFSQSQSFPHIPSYFFEFSTYSTAHLQRRARNFSKYRETSKIFQVPWPIQTEEIFPTYSLHTFSDFPHISLYFSSCFLLFLCISFYFFVFPSYFFVIFSTYFFILPTYSFIFATWGGGRCTRGSPIVFRGLRNSLPKYHVISRGKEFTRGSPVVALGLRKEGEGGSVKT